MVQSLAVDGPFLGSKLSAIRNAPSDSRTPGWETFSWTLHIIVPLGSLGSVFLYQFLLFLEGDMYLFLIKKSFLQQLRAMTQSINSHTCAAVWTWGGGLTTFSEHVSSPPSRGDVSLQTKVSQRCLCFFQLQGPRPERAPPFN